MCGCDAAASAAPRRGELKTEAAVDVFEPGSFAVENDAEGVQGVVGGELVSSTEHGFEELFLRERPFGEDLENGLFQGKLVAGAASWSVKAVITHGGVDAHGGESLVNRAEAREERFAFSDDVAVKGNEPLNWGRSHVWKTVISLRRPLQSKRLGKSAPGAFCGGCECHSVSRTGLWKGRL